QPPRPIPVACDPNLIRRTLVNLVGNALKFAPARSPVQLALSADQERAHVRVVDQGPGIPSEYRTRIFEKFGQLEARRQKRQYGTGLGLAFCKLAVEAHGGSIGVESEVGKGSVFWFVLPVARERWSPPADAGVVGQPFTARER